MPFTLRQTPYRNLDHQPNGTSCGLASPTCTYAPSFACSHLRRSTLFPLTLPSPHPHFALTLRYRAPHRPTLLSLASPRLASPRLASPRLNKLSARRPPSRRYGDYGSSASKSNWGSWNAVGTTGSKGTECTSRTDGYCYNSCGVRTQARGSAIQRCVSNPLPSACLCHPGAGRRQWPPASCPAHHTD